jgi:adenylate cyclase
MAEERASASQPIPSRGVFISYASQDAGVAHAIVDTLEKTGLECWIAPRDVTPGAHYADEIMGAISGAKALILVLSDSALASKHVSKEVERASSKGRPIIAVRLGQAPLTPALEYFLSESQWIDAPDGNVAAVLPKLVAAVQRLSRAVTEAMPEALELSRGSTLAGSSTRPGARRSKVSGLGIGAFAMIAFAALAYYFVPRLWPPRRPIPATAAPPTAAIGDKSIAVLPFIDMSEKHDQEYFGDGMAEEILDLLAKVPGLTVIGRTSSFQFKGKNEDLRAIGTKLNTAYVLEGSVRNSGDQVRITAQLIDTRSGAHVWSETYDRHVGDILKLQDAIALAVVRALQLTVVPADLDSRAALKNAGAYDLMLRGRHAFDRLEREGYDEAVLLFQEALDRDPTLADAASWLGRTYETMGEAGDAAPGLVIEKSRRMAELALRLDPRSAEAHALLANIHIFYDWDWAAAEREIRQAKLIAPSDPYVQRAGAILALCLGRWDDALRQIKAAVLVDPFDPINYQFMSFIQERLGQVSEAEASVRRLLDISPAYTGMRSYLASLLWEQGNHDGALKELQRDTDRKWKLWTMTWFSYALGRKAESDAALAEFIKGNEATDAYAIADLYALRGRPDEAMNWLERAFTQKNTSLALIKSDMSLASLANDPRFKAFLRKMNLPE